MELHLYTGPMFSGKSQALIQAHGSYPGHSRLCYIPQMDHRSKKTITSWNGWSLPAIVVEKETDIKFGWSVFIDEAQFFDATELYRHLVNNIGVQAHVHVAGLQYDSNKRLFEWLWRLEPFASSVIYFKAHCVLCDALCEHTYRRPEVGIARLIVGGDEIYQPRCEACWGKP